MKEFTKGLTFKDGAKAQVLVMMDVDRIEVVVEAEGTKNRQVWDRKHVRGIRSRNVHHDEYVVHLIMGDGTERPLPMLVSGEEAETLVGCF